MFSHRHWKRGSEIRRETRKLHAKLAIIDDVALISSAILTNDAFNRNLEIGVITTNRQFLDRIQDISQP